MPLDEADLLRTRNNQRRSRARKKEYLQEVETKLRHCESVGAEASAELQRAAQHVAHENRKLRELLIAKGIKREYIEDYLRSDVIPDAFEPARNDGHAVQTLQKSLARRKCCPNPRVSNNSSDGGCRQDISYDRMSTSGDVGNLPWTKTEPEMQTLAAKVPITPFMNRSSEAAAWPIPVETASNTKPASTSYHFTQIGGPQDSNQDVSEIWNDIGHTIVPVPPSIPNVCSASCSAATDMINTMTGVDPMVIRAELGCGARTECEVDTHVTFSVMDRYSNSTTLDL